MFARFWAEGVLMFMVYSVRAIDPVGVSGRGASWPLTPFESPLTVPFVAGLSTGASSSAGMIGDAVCVLCLWKGGG